MYALFSIAVVLIVMLGSIWRKMSLDMTILLGVIMTSLLFGRIGSLPADFMQTIGEQQTISLMLLVYLVFFLTGFMTHAGIMKRVVESLENMIADPRAIIAFIPMVIGFIPVLSGAVISAPFADEIGERTRLSKERRHVINYWFRHISEYVNPIYPGVILTCGLMGISFYTFLIANVPVMAVYALIGLGLFILPMHKPRTAQKRLRLKDVITVVRGLSPILLAVTLPVAFGLGLPQALAVAIVLAIILNHKAGINLVKIGTESLKIDILGLVLLVMLFSTVLDNTNATTQISNSLLALGIPPTALLISIPMLVGFLTGLTIGFVGLTFPILMPLLAPGGVANLPYVTLAYVSGYIGLLISPMHLCFSVTQKYFGADLRKSYGILLPPLAATLVWMLIYVSFIM
jgi:integral membrane protein (TIGR00529 family)